MVRSLLAASCVVASVAAWSAATASAEEKNAGPTYRMVGDYTSVYGFEALRVEAVGLVVGLNKTGGDPAPGVYREQVLTLMRQNDVEQPEKVLASKNVAAVMLRANVPPGA